MRTQINEQALLGIMSSIPQLTGSSGPMRGHPGCWRTGGGTPVICGSEVEGFSVCGRTRSHMKWSQSEGQAAGLREPMKTSRGLGSNSKRGGPTRLTPKGVPICRDAGVHRNAPPWKCKALRDIKPQVRDQIIEAER